MIPGSSGGLLRAVSKGSSCFSFFCSSLFRVSFFSMLSFVLAYFHLNLDVVILRWQLLLKVDVLSVLCKVRFSDFLIFRKMLILGIFRWDLGSGRVCNGLEMAVGFKWTDSQLISMNMSPFSTIFIISMILRSFPVV